MSLAKAVANAAAMLVLKAKNVPKSGKEYVKAVYCHPAYSTYMQNAS